jgi:hypothetical protein
MVTVTMAELSRHTRQAVSAAQQEGVVVTNNGRATGLLIGVDGMDLGEATSAARQILAQRALAGLQAQAATRGLNAMTMDEINAVIADVRQERHARGA